MSRAPCSSRFAAWLAVCLLVLKAAVPFFAAGAAHARGVPVAEVCPIYGVALHAAHAGHAQDHDGPAHHSPAHQQSEALHASGDCALTALASMAAPDGAAADGLPAHGTTAAPIAPSAHAAPPDACAAWAARLMHAPPVRA